MDYTFVWVNLSFIYYFVCFLTSYSSGERVNTSSRCKAASAATDHLYDSLHEHMLLEERCKRYAVMLTIVVSKGQTNQEATTFLEKLEANGLNLLYEQIDPRYLVALYIEAVDGYRKTKLGPAFLELIECMKKIDRPSVKIYLDSEELNFITDLYRHVIQWPKTLIDFDKMDLSNFHPGFKTRLTVLFQDYLVGTSSSKQPGAQNQGGQDSEEPRHKNREKQHSTSLSPVKRNRRRKGEAGLTVEQLQQYRLKKKREANRKRMQKIRQEDPGRYREQDRLRQRRLRLLKPDEVRAGDRERQRRRRARLREERDQMRERQRQLYLEHSTRVLSQQQLNLYAAQSRTSERVVQ